LETMSVLNNARLPALRYGILTATCVLLCMQTNYVGICMELRCCVIREILCSLAESLEFEHPNYMKINGLENIFGEILQIES
jgi:hypothetical protein